MTDLLDQKTLTAQVDRLLLQQGRLDPLELLLALDLLSYEDYQEWRLGRRSDLQDALLVRPAVVVALMEQAAAYGRGQGLQPVPLEHRRWGEQDAFLSIGPNQELSRACDIAYVPAADRRQLDLFHDSRELLIETGLREALAQRRLTDVRERVAELAHHNPRHEHLRGYLQLLQIAEEGEHGGLESSTATWFETLDGIELLARNLLGHQARDFLRNLWAEFAQRLAWVAFDPTAPGLHASHAWRRAERWDAVRVAVEQVADWRDHPSLLALHAEASWRRREPAAARRDWAWMCWEYPQQAERLLASPSFPDQQVRQLWQAFEDLELAAGPDRRPSPGNEQVDLLDTEDFPAFLLLHDPSAAAAVPTHAAPDDDRGAAYRLLHRIVSGGDDIALRRELGDIHPLLLRLLLASRRAE
jgi:hypothetical protein